MSPTWHLYVLQCADGTLYAGVTTDLERRLEEHNIGPKGARYTRARRPVTLLHAWNLPDRSAATKAEAAFKRLSRAHKLEVIAGHRPLPCGAPL
jgi:putative endonuclease